MDDGTCSPWVTCNSSVVQESIRWKGDLWWLSGGRPQTGFVTTCDKKLKRYKWPEKTVALKHMKTHVHKYDILHAGEIPRKEDVSVANIKHKKGLEKDKQPQATSPFQWHGPKQWRRCGMSLSRYQGTKCAGMHHHVGPHLLITRHLVLQHNLHFYKL